jgi:hypothetical protein
MRRSKRADRATVENTFNFRIENAFEEAVSDKVPEEQQEEFLSYVRLSTDVDWAEKINKEITSIVSNLYDEWLETRSPGSEEGRFPGLDDEDFDETPPLDLDEGDEDLLEKGQVVDEFEEDFDEVIPEEPGRGRPKKSG